MKRFAAQFILTNCGPPLIRGVITTHDDGTISGIENTGGNLEESSSTHFYNGIIIPGFVNSHCHLELSHLKGKVAEGTGVGSFIMQVRSIRDVPRKKIVESALSADRQLSDEGIMVCADICNTSLTFGLKKKSLVKYINLLEVFGIDPRKAVKRMDEVSLLAEEAEETGTDYAIVPHSVYSVSLPLFRKIKERTILNKVTSIHFQESADEPEFLASHAGDLKESYEASGLLPPVIDIAGSHSDAILNEVTSSGNLILVHNTYTDVDTIRQVNKRRNTFWCLCPSSNMYIEKKLPPADLLMSEGCVPVIGTDSLASNKKLSILSELKLLQNGFPSISLEELIKWGTINGARALGVDNNYGTIGPGMRPGLLLLENVDLQNLRLLPETTVTRLV